MCEQVPQALEFGLRMATGHSPLIPSTSGTLEAKAATSITAAVLIARSELRRLRQAELYWVDQDMTSLALAAAATPTHEPVRARRMPAEAGLMVFAHPIGSREEYLANAITGSWYQPTPGTDKLRLSYPIVAVSWSRWTPSDLEPDNAPDKIRWTPRTPSHAKPLTSDFDGVWLTFWTTGDKGWGSFPPEQPIAIEKHTGKTITAGRLATNATRAATLLTYNEFVLRFDHPLPDLNPHDGSQWAHVVYTAWQLMTQTGNAQLSESDTVARPRSGLKRDKRAQIPRPGTVQLVRVHSRHRPSSQASIEDAAASHGRRAPQWTRRWPVRPYRRNTCLNPHAHAEGGCEHEERVVPAHIKGPTDKPLIATNKVHIWDNPPPSPPES